MSKILQLIRYKEEFLFFVLMFNQVLVDLIPFLIFFIFFTIFFGYIIIIMKGGIQDSGSDYPFIPFPVQAFF